MVAPVSLPVEICYEGAHQVDLLLISLMCQDISLYS